LTNRSRAGGCAGGRYPFLTQKERDIETGLDYFINRYYSSTQGRFTSVDPTLQSIDPANPQTLNRYTYALNNPLAFIDPDGLDPLFIGSYDKLTDEQKRLFETYVQKNYAEELENPLFSAESLWNNSAAVANGDAAAGPNSRLLDDGQLTNFIGVTKMLEKRGVIDQVASISEIHGDKPEGKTYRVYGELKNNTTAVEAIKKAFTHKIPGKGHGEYSESRREQGLFGAPNGQVNRVPTGTGVDIDVDYRCILCPGHVSKGGVGSDIRVGTHYEEAVWAYAGVVKDQRGGPNKILILVKRPYLHCSEGKK
jgi:RHS repeat-associated protein